MASPQLEDGFTRIAHEIMEALAKINLSPYESRVLWFVLRKTYGWHKKNDWIASSQFRAGLGGLDRSNIFRAQKSLLNRSIIVVSRDNRNNPIYSFQKDYSKWITLSQKTTGVVSRDTSALSVETHIQKILRQKIVRVPESDKLIPDSLSSNEEPKSAVGKQLLSDRPTIPPHPKEKQTRAAPAVDSRVKAFFDWWAMQYEIRFRAKYVFNGGKEGKLIKALPADYDIAKLKSLASRFFDSDDEWIKQRGGYTLGVFISQLNKLASTGGAHSGAFKPAEVKDLGDGWLEVDGMKISRKDFDRRQWKTA